MLVLTRKVGEVIVIGGAIRVQVLAIKGGSVQLGVAAPPDIAVDRAEIHAQRAQWAADLAEPDFDCPLPMVVGC